MMKFLIASALTLTAGAALAAGGGMPMDMHHGEHHDHMAMMQGAGSAAASPVVSSTGVVKAVRPDAGKVTITHEPIASLGWPAMTMNFTAKDPALIQTLKAGDKVSFTFRQEGRLSVLVSLEVK